MSQSQIAGADRAPAANIRPVPRILHGNDTLYVEQRLLTIRFSPAIRFSLAIRFYKPTSGVIVNNNKYWLSLNLCGLLSSPLYTNPASNSSDLSEQLSSTLNSILDIHAPLKSKIVVLRPHTPLINPEILVAKRERSRLERSWHRWKSPFDRKKFRAQCNFVRSLISKAKSNFLTNLVTESSSNPRTLWKTLNSILHRNPSNSSPDTPDTQSLANSFLQFFNDKIERIRSKFSPSDSPDPFLFPIIPPPNLSNFNPTTFSEIRNLIFSSQKKQYELDSIPTFLLKLCFDELGPTIINIINFSLSEGIFPIFIQTSNRSSSTQKTFSSWWWSQQLSSYF